MPRAVALDRAQAIATLEGFLKDFERWFAQPGGPAPVELQRWLTPGFHLWSNGELIIHSTDEYVERIANLHRRYESCQVEPIMGETVVCNHTAVVQYRVHLTAKDRKTTDLHLMAIAHFEEDKIAQWTQVVHQKGLPHWDQ